MSNLIDLQTNSVTIAKDPTTFTDTDAVNKLFVDTQITNLIDTAPASLDTLNELAAAINDDPNFHTTVTTSISTAEAARIAEDIAINSRLDTVNSTLGSDNTTETAARIAQDNALTTLLNQEIALRTARATELTNAKDASTSFRTAADTALNTRVDDEEAARAAADTALDVAKIDKSTKYLKRGDANFAIKDDAYLYIGEHWRISANNLGANKKLEIEYSADGIIWELGVPLFTEISLHSTIEQYFPTPGTPVDLKMYMHASEGSPAKLTSSYPNNKPIVVIDHLYDPATPGTNPFGNTSVEEIFHATIGTGNTLTLENSANGNQIAPAFSDVWYNDPVTAGQDPALEPPTLASASGVNGAGSTKNQFLLENIQFLSNTAFSALVQHRGFVSNKYLGIHVNTTSEQDGHGYSTLVDQADAVRITFSLQ
jgi:hypothetical protein